MSSSSSLSSNVHCLFPPIPHSLANIFTKSHCRHGTIYPLGSSALRFKVSWSCMRAVLAHLDTMQIETRRPFEETTQRSVCSSTPRRGTRAKGLKRWLAVSNDGACNRTGIRLDVFGQSVCLWPMFSQGYSPLASLYACLSNSSLSFPLLPVTWQPFLF